MRSRVSRMVGPEIESAATATPSGAEDRARRARRDRARARRPRPRSRARGSLRRRRAARPRTRAAPCRSRSTRRARGGRPSSCRRRSGGDVLLREVLDAERRRHAEVDRLAGKLGERAQRGRGELDEARARVAVREAEQHRARARRGGRPRAGRARGARARRRGARWCSSAARCSAASSPTPSGRCDSTTLSEQVRGTVDRLRPRLGRHSPYGGTCVPRLSSGCYESRESRLAATSSRKPSGSRKNVA